MRRYMLDFVQLFASHITDSQIEQNRLRARFSKFVFRRAVCGFRDQPTTNQAGSPRSGTQ